MEKDRKSFLMYIEWENQFDIINDEEKIRFIYNLFKYHKGEDVELITVADKLVWNGVLPALRTNQQKYQERVEKNRKNGKLGGRPPQDTSQNQMVSSKTQNNPEKPNGFSENPKNPVTGDRQETTGNSKEVIEKSIKETGDRELVTGNGEKVIDNPVDEIGDVSNSSSGDFNNTSIEDNSRSERNQEILNKAGTLFKDISNWQQEIEDLGPKGFIKKYSQIVGPNEESYDLVKDYYNKIYMGFGD